MSSAPGERVALLLTVRRAGAAPLISITHASEPSSLQERLNTTSAAEAVAFVSRWLESHTTTLDEAEPS